VKVWSRETFRLLWSSVGHHASVNALDISPDSSRIVSASSDRTLASLALWEISSEGLSQIRTFTGHKRGVACVRFLPLSDQARIPRSSQSQSTSEELFASGSLDKSIRIWRANTGECVRTLEGHTDLVRGLVYDASAGLLISGSHDNTIVFWQLRLVDYLFADSVQSHDPGSDEKLRVFKRYRNRIFGLGISGHRIIWCAFRDISRWLSTILMILNE